MSQQLCYKIFATIFFHFLKNRTQYYYNQILTTSEYSLVKPASGLHLTGTSSFMPAAIGDQYEIVNI